MGNPLQGVVTPSQFNNFKTQNGLQLVNYLSDTPHEEYLFYDGFDRVDSATTLGNSEVPVTVYTILFQTGNNHVWGTQNGKAYTVSGTVNTRGIACQETNESDCIIEANVNSVTTTPTGIAFRVQDVNNFWALTIQNNNVAIIRYISGSISTLKYTNVGTGVTSGKLTAVVNKNKISVYFNDILLYETYDSAFNTATKHGLYSRIDPVARFDNLCVKKLYNKKQFNYTLNGLSNPLPWFALLQNANQSYSFGYNSNIIDNGISSLRFELDYGDPDSNVGRKRSEISTGGSGIKAKQLEEHWFSANVYLPNGDEDYAVDNFSGINNVSNDTIMQWHGSPDNGDPTTNAPCLSLQTNKGYWYVQRCWNDQEIQSTYTTENNNLGSYLPDKGRWVNWTFHIKWGWLSAQNPITEVYKDYQLILTKNGLPNCYNDAVAPYFKFGIYKRWDLSPSDVSKRVIYFNNISVK